MAYSYELPPVHFGGHFGPLGFPGSCSAAASRDEEALHFKLLICLRSIHGTIWPFLHIVGLFAGCNDNGSPPIFWIKRGPLIFGNSHIAMLGMWDHYTLLIITDAPTVQ